MFGLSKKEKLDKRLITEIKQLAGVYDLPWEDAQDIARLLQAYENGDISLIGITMLGSMSTLEKYPELYSCWDDLMIKYHKLGLFPNWNISIGSNNDIDSNHIDITDYDDAFAENDDLDDELVDPLYSEFDTQSAEIAGIMSEILLSEDVSNLALCILAICDEHMYRYKSASKYAGAVYLQYSIKKSEKFQDDNYINDILVKYEAMRLGLDELYDKYVRKDYNREDKLGKNIWYIAAVVLALQNAAPRCYKKLIKRFNASSPLECAEAIHMKGIEKNNILQTHTIKMAKMLYRTLDDIK